MEAGRKEARRSLEPNPPDAALITYYQKKRHIFGKMKIEIFDAKASWWIRCRPTAGAGLAAWSGPCG